MIKGLQKGNQFKHENLQIENSIRCTISGVQYSFFFRNHLQNLLLTLSKFKQINYQKTFGFNIHLIRETKFGDDPRRC